jgi:hypothetical protein
VKLVRGSGDNCLHWFVENVFVKKSTEFNLNRPSFVNVMVKASLVCFFMPHSVLFADSFTRPVAVFFLLSVADGQKP